MAAFSERDNEKRNAVRWLLVSRRDAAANSAFLYGVTTTRIFCRPTCPGRVARRANVVFFNDHNDALERGYRPCKRCEPLTEGWTREQKSWKIAHRARELIEAAETAEEEWTVEAVAKQLQISSAHLHRQFKRWFQMTPKAYGASMSTSTRTATQKTAIPKSASSSPTNLPSAIYDSATTLASVASGQAHDRFSHDENELCAFSRLEQFFPSFEAESVIDYSLCEDGINVNGGIVW